MSFGRKLTLSSALDRRHDDVDVEAMTRPQQHAGQRADHADQRALHHEDPHDLRGLAPSVRRMAMSACLSVTVITSVETRLNAATATISVRMMNIMRFSICTAREPGAVLRVQSRISELGAAALSRQLARHVAAPGAGRSA